MRLKSRRWLVALALVASLAWADVSAQSAPPSVTFGTLPVLQSTTPVPGSTRIPGDFNGDRMSDLLWFNPLENKLGYWLMDIRIPTPTDRAITKTGTRLFNITPGYFVGAVGDFNADGYADLMFTSSHRDLWLWTNNGRGAFKSARSYDYPAGWQLVGAGDIDGNGYDDLLWLNPDGCQFAYWLMKGGVRVGSRTMDVSCGYYPIGVGYYTPSNRLSILWSSPANDLYIWDSTGKGFRTYDLSADVPMGGVWALGGGFKGRDIGIEHNDPTNPTTPNGPGQILDRSFDAGGRQTGIQVTRRWFGAPGALAESAGYAIRGAGDNVTGLYMIYPGTGTISSGGVSGPTAFTGNAPIPEHYVTSWFYPVGWYVVGAPANRAIAPPWN